MITIEDVRTCLFILAFFIACFAVIAYAWRSPTGAAKLLCLIAVVVLGLIGFASAETDIDEVKTIDFKRVEPVLFNDEAMLRIWFNYNGELLSWYDTMFLPQMEYRIIIFGGEEVIDAEPLLDAVAR